ncbi:MAG: hypothetical protein US22_C0032G0008 [candidate division TM6 bacterium GW2011_GWF2_36_6]|nr:MAG: hypothetical protein US22_C0032G0008 [candidate division TM6 bacterium GW2011_GWF2_36_6]
MKFTNKFRSSYLLLVFVLLPACSFFKSDIKEIDSIKEVALIFEHATNDDLFVFDVDQVILESTEPFMQARFDNNSELKKIADDFFEFIKSTKNPDAMDLFFSKMNLSVKTEPVEQLLIDQILALQKRSIKVITLTALNTGKFGLIDRLEDWRYKQLLNLGLNFESSFEQKEIVIGELLDAESINKKVRFKERTRKDAGPIVFYKGIICSTCYSKGPALKAFLDKAGYRPSQIYFFDDRPNNVKSVVQAMKTMGIKCQGFIYKAAAVKQPTDDLDIDVIKLQHELMRQRDDYVSYLDAKEVLEQKKLLNKNAVPAATVAQ